MRCFISGTGTGVGKTIVSRGLARAAARHGSTVGIKPYETGVTSLAEDAQALAQAAGHEVINDMMYRVEPPLSPLSATLEGQERPATLRVMADAIRALADPHAHAVVEGAGGLLVPITETETIADLAVELAWPVVLVAPNGLGVQSSALCAHEAAGRRGLNVRALVLCALPEPDLSQRTNQRVLETFGIPVFSLPRFAATVTDDELADAVVNIGLFDAISRTPRSP